MKLQGYFRFSIAIVILLTIFSGCDKAEDGSAPSLSVFSPDDNDEFAIGDSINVIGSVTNNFLIKNIKIVLWDNFNNPVLPSLFIYPDAYGYNFDVDYFIDDETLETGTYYLLISATDGNNETRVFRKLHISGIDKVFERLLVIAPPNTLKTHVYALDTNGDPSIFISLDYSYAGSDISNDLQKFYMIKSEPSIMYAYDLDDPTDPFTYDAAPPYPVFNSVNYFDKLVYLPTGNGDIKGIDSYGSISFVSPQNQDTIPQLMHLHYDRVLAYCNRRGGPERFIAQYYAGTGVSKSVLKIPFTVVDFFNIEENIALALGNESGSSSIYVYNSNGSFLADKTDMPPGLIRCAEQLSLGNYLIAHDAGIYRYVHETNSLTEYLPGVEAQHLAYDQVNQLLYVANQQFVSMYSLTDPEPLKVMQLPYPVLNMHIQYNR